MRKDSPQQRLTRIITESVDALDPLDRADRISHCQQTGRHGVDLVFAEHDVTLWWADQKLAVVEKSVFTDDDAEPHLAGWIDPDDVPDSVPDEWNG
ncbi:hypothetical protein [Rhodococcus artemisiae]|uniref:Uncharacterized protein n=1 Tax=Rhodococcus artemisiae TaxID=714159 RepID=A0ABU7L4X9_9NOCA|nr:hypothetical protein [Rhodococcus artemisiae]MEE2056605.1 hypothetical protein [Rhodococcus artemisiae]